MPILLALMVAAVAAPLSAQEDSAALAAADSLRARLERAEEAIELLRQQLATQAASEVRTRSRARLEFSGRMLVNAFANDRQRLNNVDVPQFALPDVADGSAPRRGSAGVVARQTTLALAASGLEMLGGDASADVSVDFFGGPQTGAGGRALFPLPRLRILRGIVRWANGSELLIGQDVPLVAPWNPESVASIGTPGFASAGNLWNWLPQIRGTLGLGGPPAADGGVRLALQAAVVAPHSGGDFAAGEPDQVDAAERSERPFLEGRLRARWGADPERPAEVGVGVHQGWLAAGGAGDELLSGGAVLADFALPLTAWLEVRGEAYSGRLLRGLGGGGIGQNFGPSLAPSGTPIRDRVLSDRGAWAQVNLRPSPAQAFGAGCGVDDPTNDELPQRHRNLACAGYATWRPGGGPLLVGLEYRRIETSWYRAAAGVNAFRSERVDNDHLNLAVGVEF